MQYIFGCVRFLFVQFLHSLLVLYSGTLGPVHIYFLYVKSNFTYESACLCFKQLYSLEQKKMLLSYKTSFKPPPPLLIYFYNCLLKHTAKFFLIGTRKQNIVYLPEMYIVMYTVYTAYCTVLCIALVNIILSLSFLWNCKLSLVLNVKCLWSI